ncbi:T9SS type A sorting domain-containing protein [Segetibacter koreensis]|uniref:Ig-like domain-containing protein n=1 Tax=Segetibacter koreensis TaxID=398037 RepID=UPI00037CBEF8|nr:T9SS type A sorting domain-containing protein [Segetibacter koreensis]
MERNLPGVIHGNPIGSKKENLFSFKKLSLTFFVSAFVFLSGLAPGKSFAQEVSLITLNSASSSSVCVGGNLNINISSTATGTNTYIVQLSDDMGSFAKPTDIGQADFTDNVNNTPIPSTVPFGTLEGTGYLIRVVSGGRYSTGLTQITVNALPSITPQAATANVCTNSGISTTTLAYAATGSPVTYSITWSSAAINQGFNPVTDANLPGSPLSISVPANAAAATYTGTITVKNASGCVSSPATFTVTINAVPPTPTIFPNGATTFCDGGNVTLSSSATAGNQWYKDGNAINGATAQTYSAAISGTYKVIVSANGCTSTASAATSVTANPAPIVPSATGSSRCGSGMVTISATSAAGTSVDWYSAPSGGTVLLSGNNTFTTPAISSTTTYYAQARNTTTGCVSATRTSVIATVNQAPTAFNLTGQSLYCTTSSGSILSLAGSETGVSYQLYRNSAIAVGSPVTGTGSSLSFSPQTIQGEYTVIAKNTSSSCTQNMTGSVLVTGQNTPPTAVAGASPNTVCEIGNVQLQAYTDTVNGKMIDYSLSTIAYNYITPTNPTTIAWQNNTEDGYTNAIPTTFPFRFFNTTYNNVYISTNGFISFSPLSASNNSNAPQAFPNPAMSNNLIALAMGNVLQSTGNAKYFISGIAPNRIFVVEFTNFKFRKNPSQINGSVNGQIQIFENKNIIEVHVTNVNKDTPPGQQVPSTLGIENADGTQGNSPPGKFNSIWDATNVAYRWVPIAGYSWSPSTFLNATNISNPVATGVNTVTNYTVTITDVIGCSTTSGPLTINVNKKSQDPTSATASASIVCSGSPVTLTLSGGGSGTSETVKWYIGSCGGTLAGVGNNLIVNPTVTTTYYGRYENGAPCNSVSICKQVTVTVNPLPTATITGTATVCQNTPSPNITFTGANGTAPYTFTYKIGSGASQTKTTTAGNSVSIPVSTTTAGSYVYNLISVQDASSTACIQAQTGSATVIVNSTPNIYTVTGGGAYCAGGIGVDVGLSSSQTGVNYQLFNNLVPVGVAKAGTTGSAISFGLQTAAGIYTVVATNTSNCTNTMTGSATITVNDPATIANQPVSQNACPGSNTSFTVKAAGTSPTYQWQVSTDGGSKFNNVTGATSSTLTISGAGDEINNNQYRVTVTGAAPCPFTTSEIVTLTVGNIWTGSNGTNFSLDKNWSCNSVPGVTDRAIIPAVANLPVLSESVTVGNLTLQSNASLDLSGKNLTVNGDITGGGKLYGDKNSSLMLNGINTSTLNFDNSNDSITNVIKDLTINSGSINLGSRLYLLHVLYSNGGTLNSNGNLTIRSTSIDSTARVAEVKGAISGDVTVERFIPKKRAYRYISPSVTTSSSIRYNWMENAVNPDINTRINLKAGYGTNITGNNPAGNGFDATITTNPSLFTFNTTTQTWVAVPNTNGTLVAGTGYSLMVRGDRSIDMRTNTPDPTPTILRAKGALFTGTYSPALSNTAGKYTFIGNPYASPVDFQKMWNNATNVTSSYYAWDPNVNTRGGYVVYNAFYDTANIATSKVDKNIQPGQAVFVQTIKNGTASIDFSEKYKSTDKNTRVFRNPHQFTKLSVQLLLNQNEGLQNRADGVFAYFDDNFSTAIGNEDSYKFTNSDENLAINHNGVSLSMEGRPTVTADDTIPLKIWQFRQKSYYLSLIGNNFSPEVTAFVRDSYLHTESAVDLSSVTLLPFTINTDSASFAKDRFSIIFKAGRTLPVTLAIVKAYQKDKGIQVDWTAQTEINIDRYEVEKSVNGQQFDQTTMLLAKGNNSATQNYGWFDENPNTGSNFYRLKVIEKSGAVKYSPVVKVNIAEHNGGIAVFPNPVKDNQVSVHFNNMEQGKYLATVYDNIGQQIYSGNIEHSGRTATYTIALSRLISKGTYTLHVHKGDTTLNERVIVE